MKTFLLFLFLCLLFPSEVNAANTNKKDFPYEITNIVINEKEIIIEGWGLATEKHHHDMNSHYYTLKLKSNSNQITYTSKPLYNSQTDIMKVLNVRKCNKNEYYQSGRVCYYNFDYVGFKFKIPLSDLKIDEIYETQLILHSNTLNFNIKADVFYPIEIPIIIMKDTIEYKIQSNLYDTELIVVDQAVFDRISPTKNSKIRQSKTYCSSTYGYSRFFEKGSVYKYVYDKQKSGSTTFYKVKTDKNDTCQLQRNLIKEGNDYESWIASNWVDYSGDPLYVMVTDLNEPPKIDILNHPIISIDKVNNFNFKDYILSIDKEDGNLTNKTIITNKVNLSSLGTHSLNLEVEDTKGKKAYETLIVTVIDTNTPPIINANNQTIYQYDRFDYLKDVSAYDEEDKDITHTIYYEGNVNTSILGTYEVMYYAKDSKNIITSKLITVEVIQNPNMKIRYISNEYDKVFYKEEIPTNWINHIQYLYDQILNPKIYIKKKIKL